MIPNHARFLEAIAAKKKVSVKFYSKADHGVLERICAPLSYGQSVESQDELNRYWLWDYAATTHPLGLLSEQIVELQLLGDVFDPAQFTTQPLLASALPTGGSPPAAAVSSDGAGGSNP